MPVISIGIAFFVFLRLCFLRNKCDDNGTGTGMCADNASELTEQHLVQIVSEHFGTVIEVSLYRTV
jgi:hypothetical protein